MGVLSRWGVKVWAFLGLGFRGFKFRGIGMKRWWAQSVKILGFAIAAAIALTIAIAITMTMSMTTTITQHYSY